MTIKTIINWIFPRQEQEQKKHNLGAINFYIDELKQVNISLSLPNNYSDILESSEIYANMLVQINHGYLFKNILSKLQSQSAKSNNHEEILLIENIMFFWMSLINQRKQNLSKTRESHSPLISPSQVFAIKN